MHEGPTFPIQFSFFFTITFDFPTRWIHYNVRFQSNYRLKVGNFIHFSGFILSLKVESVQFSHACFNDEGSREQSICGDWKFHIAFGNIMQLHSFSYNLCLLKKKKAEKSTKVLLLLIKSHFLSYTSPVFRNSIRFYFVVFLLSAMQSKMARESRHNNSNETIWIVNRWSQA